MNILVAPNSMKGSLNAFDFADAVEQAFLEVSGNFNIRKIPVADGGDFTGAVLAQALNAKEVQIEVAGPLGEKIKASYAVAGKTAVIEMAGASGIKLLKNNQLNPMKTSSFGTGQLITDAINNGCHEIFLGIGGSATVEGGTGMMEAMGFKLLDEKGQELEGNGGNLGRIKDVKKTGYPVHVSFKIISDVSNPLLGKNGAAAVFGPQKGASPEMVENLEKGLKNWVELLEEMSGKKLAGLNGAGAAGGIALPLLAFFNAEIVPGADFILSQLNFETHVKWADLVITGEGKIDSQTLSDKAPAVVAKTARKYGKPVIAFGGSVSMEAAEAFDGIFSMMNESMSLEKAMENSRELVFNFSTQLARFVQALIKNHG